MTLVTILVLTLSACGQTGAADRGQPAVSESRGDAYDGNDAADQDDNDDRGDDNDNNDGD